jgi:hypothetical protein
VAGHLGLVERNQKHLRADSQPSRSIDSAWRWPADSISASTLPHCACQLSTGSIRVSQ